MWNDFNHNCMETLGRILIINKYTNVYNLIRGSLLYSHCVFIELRAITSYTFFFDFINTISFELFQAVIKKRQYCARAREVCSPSKDDFNDDPAVPDV